MIGKFDLDEQRVYDRQEHFTPAYTLAQTETDRNLLNLEHSACQLT